MRVDQEKHGGKESVDPYVIGKNIAYCRKYNGMTQRELAERCFVTQRAVSKWECGVSLPDVSLLPQIARIFGISLDELASDRFSYENRRPASVPVSGQSGEAIPKRRKKLAAILIVSFAFFAVAAVAVLLGVFLSRYSGRVFVFEAEWGMPGSHSGDARYRAAANDSSGAGYVDFIAGGNDVIYEITSTESVSAEFTLCVGLRINVGYETLSEVYEIEVNGEPIALTEAVPSGKGISWLDWTEIGAGCIRLNAGKNVISVTSVNWLSLDYFSLRPKTASAVLTLGDCTDVYEGDTVTVATNDLSGLENAFAGGRILSVCDVNEYIDKPLLERGEGTELCENGWINLWNAGDYLWKVAAQCGEKKSVMLVPVSLTVDGCLFEAEWAETSAGDAAFYCAGINGSSGRGFLDFRRTKDNVSAVRFHIAAGDDVEVELDVRVGKIHRELTLSEVYGIEVNGEPLVTDAYVPRTGKNQWHDWITVDCGGIVLKKGENILEFKGFDTALCLDYIRLRPKTRVRVLFSGCGVGYGGERLNVTDTDFSALSAVLGGEIVSVVDMDERYETLLGEGPVTDLLQNGTLRLRSSGEKTWRVTAVTAGGEVSALLPVNAEFSRSLRLEAEDGRLSGNASVVSGYGASGAAFVDYLDEGTVAISFDGGAYAGTARLLLCVGAVNDKGVDLRDVYAVTFNGAPVPSDAYVPRGRDSLNWHDWMQIDVGIVELSADGNEIEISDVWRESGVKPLCLDYILLVPVGQAVSFADITGIS